MCVDVEVAAVEAKGREKAHPLVSVLMPIIGRKADYLASTAEEEASQYLCRIAQFQTSRDLAEEWEVL